MCHHDNLMHPPCACAFMPKGLNKPFEAVKDFHKAFNHPVGKEPSIMFAERVRERYGWMYEELVEFIDANTVEDQADAMIDLMYFALGTLVEMGIEPENLFNIVQNANMSKLWPDGKPHYRESDGKVKKPEGWTDPKDLIIAEIKRQKDKIQIA